METSNFATLIEFPFFIFNSIYLKQYVWADSKSAVFAVLQASCFLKV